MVKTRKKAKKAPAGSVKKKKPKRVVKAAASAKNTGKKAPGELRYLVLDTPDHVKITAASVLTPRLRLDAKEGRICIVDCDRVLAMTPRGAWSRIEEGYAFKREDLLPIVAVVEAAPQPAPVAAPEPVATAEAEEEEDEHEEEQDEEAVKDSTPVAAGPVEAHA